MKIGAAVASITKTSSRLASSLPRTSSWLLSRVIKSSRIVFLSFSCETALAERSAARKVISASWSSARIRKMFEPNRAMSPTVRMICVWTRTSQAVHMSPKTATP
jgi:hypothetical protein